MLNIFDLSERIPTKRDTFLLFVTCLILINVWSILNFLKVIPSFTLYLKVGEIISVGAYTLAFALIESIGVLLFLLVVIIILPKRLFGDKVLVKSATFIWGIALWALSFHYLYLLIPKW